MPNGTPSPRLRRTDSGSSHALIFEAETSLSQRFINGKP